ncbi:MAG: hypothetical protein KDA57_14325 [Planctomycetales bacterium]|nr:hypothetical protein [Planctomycetales bacterium]
MPKKNADYMDGDALAGSFPETDDPVFRNTLREAKLIFLIWAAAFVYTCSFCYLFGYLSHPSDPSATGPAVSSWLGPLERFDRDPATLSTPLGLGIPDWVFYGIIFPWIACLVATFGFCLFVFKEDPLGDDLEEMPTTVAGGSRDD